MIRADAPPIGGVRDVQTPPAAGEDQKKERRAIALRDALISCRLAYAPGRTDATLLIAFEIPPDNAVKATITARQITARTTPYSAIV